MALYPLICKTAREVWGQIAKNLRDRSILDDEGSFDKDLGKEIDDEQIDVIYEVLVKAYESGSRES